jgi:hypothetical protein
MHLKLREAEAALKRRSASRGALTLKPLQLLVASRFISKHVMNLNLHISHASEARRRSRVEEGRSKYQRFNSASSLASGFEAVAEATVEALQKR